MLVTGLRSDLRTLMLLGLASAAGGSCVPAVDTFVLSRDQVRLQVVALDPDHPDPQQLAAEARSAAGTFDHVVLVHSTLWDREGEGATPQAFALATAGGWFDPAADEPWPAAAEWAGRAGVGEVSPVLRRDGSNYLLRLAQRLHAGQRVVAEAPADLVSLIAERPRLERRLKAGVLELRLEGAAVVEALERMGGTAADEWYRLGPAWIGLSRALGSDVLRLWVLNLWTEALVREHRLYEAGSLMTEMLSLREKHRDTSRRRADLARKVAQYYDHAGVPFQALDVVLHHLPSLDREGRYVLSCTLAQQLADLQIFPVAENVLDQAAALAADDLHIHGPNHHLIRSTVFAARGQLDQAIEEARRAFDWAVERMHAEERLPPGNALARLLLENGQLAAAEEQARSNLRWAASLAKSSGDGHFCPLPSLEVLYEIAVARGEAAAGGDLEDRLLREAAERHGEATLSEILSLMAMKHLDEDPARAVSDLRRALEIRDRTGIDHLNLDAQLRFLDRSRRTGEHRDLAESMAEGLYRRLETARRRHLPGAPTPSKRREREKFFVLLEYYLETGRAQRAVRLAERLIAVNFLRDLLILSAGIERLAPAGEAAAGIAAGLVPAGLEEHYAAHFLSGSTLGGMPRQHRRKIENFASRSLERLEDGLPYPYAAVLEDGDLFVAYLGQGQKNYMLRWFEGTLDLLPLPVTDFAGEVRHLTEVLAGSIPAGPAVEEAGRRLYDLLLRPGGEAIERAGRLVVSPGPDLAGLPFALLRRGGRYLGEEIPIVYVDTGLPLDARHLAAGTLPEPAVAAVVFADPGGDLPHTRSALTQFARSGERRVLKAGAEASEAALWSLGGRFRLLHLDAHAELETRAGLEQVVVRLAEGNREDGMITLFEWTDRLACQPEVVSIIACRSGAISVAERGWDLRGLGGVMAARGVPWVLTTFWRVEDRTSACFARQFLERVMAGERPDRVLPQISRRFGSSCAGSQSAGEAPEWGAYRLSFLPIPGSI